MAKIFTTVLGNIIMARSSIISWYETVADHHSNILLEWIMFPAGKSLNVPTLFIAFILRRYIGCPDIFIF